jgi:hypothetical protein
VCGTVVLADDAIGTVAGSRAHAECALAAWLCEPDGSGSVPLDALLARLGARIVL